MNSLGLADDSTDEPIGDSVDGWTAAVHLGAVATAAELAKTARIQRAHRSLPFDAVSARDAQEAVEMMRTVLRPRAYTCHTYHHTVEPGSD